jgi:hypothetical protein
MNLARETISKSTPEIKPEETTPSVESINSDSIVEIKKASKRKNGWNKRNMRLARVWLERVRNMERTYYKRVSSDRIKNKVLFTSCILFTAIMSAIAGSNIAVYGCSDDLRINITLFVVGILATFLSTLNGWCNYQKNIENYKYSYDKFSYLARKLEFVVDTANNQRPNAKDFLNKVSEKYYKYQAFGDQLIEDYSDDKDIREKLEEHKHALKFEELDEGIKLELPENIDYDGIINNRLHILDSYMKNDGRKKDKKDNKKDNKNYMAWMKYGGKRTVKKPYNGPVITPDLEDIASIDFV